ncbi:zinc finger protein 597-like isoform X4 [Vombatus ursinus]|uniref:zinc finger protein 597-like isoform X4 n=1 Tax=Vombatus ursinus TaxID=29139 RepID=UPI000FFD9662|nr:zinc finger protein 597-like isoform X4 [Vombatus ursinus]
MASIHAAGSQASLMFEDLAVYFSREECVSLNPSQSPLCWESVPKNCKDLISFGDNNEKEEENFQQENPENGEVDAVPSEWYKRDISLHPKLGRECENEPRFPDQKRVL